MDCPICEGPVEVRFDAEQDYTGRIIPRVDTIERDCKCIWSDKVEADFVDQAEESATDFEPYGDY
jgi:hypothetical protein